MATFRKVFASSIGTKLIIGLTGLALFAYLVLHLAGNLLFFLGTDIFNGYSHTLISNQLIIPIELGLAVIFIIHVYKTLTMWFENQRARPIAYQRKRWANHTSRKSIGSTTMVYTGLFTLLFVVIHLKQFKFGVEYLTAGGGGIRDLYRLEREVFSNAAWVAVYAAGMILIFFHLRHGVSSACQSLGLEHPRYTRRLLLAGLLGAIIVAGGLGFIPVWVYFTR